MRDTRSNFRWNCTIIENSLFEDNHYIECYLIKNNVCITIGHVQVPIVIS